MSFIHSIHKVSDHLLCIVKNRKNMKNRKTYQPRIIGYCPVDGAVNLQVDIIPRFKDFVNQ